MDEDLKASWKRTEGFLLDARNHFSEAAEGICASELLSAEDYIRHNEFELALNSLEEAFEKSGLEGWRVLELIARAAASMGLVERQRAYDKVLTEARGWEYHTSLG